MASYTNTNEFINDLIKTYETIILIVKSKGEPNIVNLKRQETFQNAIEIVNKVDKTKNIKDIILELSNSLTIKPSTIMKNLYENGEVVLEDKPPYGGVTIKNGLVQQKTGGKSTKKKFQGNMEAFKNLSILSGIGIGIGDAAVAELVKFGYSNINELNEIYKKNRFEDFRKGLKVPLCRYFDGLTTLNKMSREEATNWKTIIDEKIKKVNSSLDQPGLFEIAGSYSRDSKEVGDIDYVIVYNGNTFLYKTLNKILDELTLNMPKDIKLEEVLGTPTKPKDEHDYYSTSIKLWYSIGKENSSKKIKVEIYGYSMPILYFFYPFFARSADVELQKKLKNLAIKKGFKLSPFGLFNNKTNKIVKDMPLNLEELTKFLEF
jgi:hypothetical protein